jgi:hypothetical protein
MWSTRPFQERVKGTVTTGAAYLNPSYVVERLIGSLEVLQAQVSHSFEGYIFIEIKVGVSSTRESSSLEAHSTHYHSTQGHNTRNIPHQQQCPPALIIPADPSLR